MARRSKKIREKGKLRLSSYFKNISDGARVSVVRERGISTSFPERIQGMAGIVFGSRGRFKEIKLKDGGKLKMFIIHPVHLRILV